MTQDEITEMWHRGIIQPDRLRRVVDARSRQERRRHFRLGGWRISIWRPV